MTVEATKFVGPHKSRMHRYIINACCSGAQLTRPLIDTGGGYHCRSSKHENRPFSPFPSGILYFPLVAPPGLNLWHILQEKNHKPHRASIGRKGPIGRGLSTTRLLPIAYTTKHSILSLLTFHRCKQGSHVRVSIMQLSFIELLYVSAQPLHSGKDFKAKT
jgi:hypothetical protein